MGSTFNIEIYEEDVKKYSSQEPQAINCEMLSYKYINSADFKLLK